MRTLTLIVLVAIGLLPVAGVRAEDQSAPAIKLVRWAQGVAIQRRDRPDMYMALWFYEWNMFEAVFPGQHTGGLSRNQVDINDAGTHATIECALGFSLRVEALDDGARMTLTATNGSGHDWPPLAAIVPCFNPGPLSHPNEQFVHQNSFFPAGEGLAPLHMTTPREIHYNAALRPAINAASDMGRFAWSDKWPTSKVDAEAGLIVRPSADGQWVAGIAWERFLSCQGHNPWNCMHLSVHLGPLRRGETRTVRGRLYLLPGEPKDVLDLYRRQFPQVDAAAP
jgi:hypothetical protein